jgi:hypothetical protein
MPQRAIVNFREIDGGSGDSVSSYIQHLFIIYQDHENQTSSSKEVSVRMDLASAATPMRQIRAAVISNQPAGFSLLVENIIMSVYAKGDAV